MWTCEGTPSNNQNNNKDPNAPTAANQHPSNILQHAWKNVYKQLTALHGMFSFECSLVWLCEQTNISCHLLQHKLLSHLKLDFKQRLTMVHVRFENCRVSLSFGWGIFINVMGLDLSCASKKIWCIIVKKTPPVIFPNFETQYHYTISLGLRLI